MGPVVLPPPPRNPPPPLQSLPLPGGGETVISLFCWAISIAVVSVPHLSHTCFRIVSPLLRISHLCVFCDILSPKAVYRVSCPFFRPKMFFLGDRVWYHSRTLGAHVLATVVGPSPNGPQCCHIWYICPGGFTQVDHESSKCAILVPRNYLLFLWTPNNLCVTLITVAEHQCKIRFTCVLFACINGGYHSLP